MRPLTRVAYEYTHLLKVLRRKDALRLIAQTAMQAPAIAKSKKLRSLDAAMSRDVTVVYRGHEIKLPLAEVDRLVKAGDQDSFTFGTIREMLGNDVYLRAFRPDLRAATVVDLGCNRGVFSLIGRVVLGATTSVGVEALPKYEPVQKLLAQENNVPPPRVYFRFAGSAADEAADAGKFVSMQTLLRENSIETIDFAKVDIEGGEVAVFSDPEWLTRTQNIAMELHPDFVDMTSVIAAVRNSGFDFVCTDQFGTPCSNEQNAMFLYASRNGMLV